MSRPLRILHISFNMPWRGGGTFYRAFGFASRLVRRGHQVTLMLTSLKERFHFIEEVVDGVRIVQSPALSRGRLRTGWDPYEVLQRCRWLRGRRFDVVHGFESRPVVIYPALFVSKRTGARLVLDWCDWMGRGGSVEERTAFLSLQERIETFFEENFRHHAQITTVINRALRDRAAALAIPSDTIHLLRNGADTEGIRVLDQKQARDALGLDSTIPLIGHLGQTFRRDAEFMATAFARILEKFPESRLVLIGNYTRDIIKQIHAGAAVIETGYVQGLRLNHYLAACDVLWLPLNDTLSNRGRWPMKLSDYMSSGRAVVSTDVGDWADLFQGEKPIGVLTAAAPRDFARKTASLLADAGARSHYGRNARHVAETIFDWSLITDTLETLYYQAVDRDS